MASAVADCERRDRAGSDLDTNIRHSGSFTLGGVSGGFFGGYTFGGRSHATTTTIENAYLEIRYQFERNASVFTTVLPFARDRRAAEELCAMLTRLEHRPASAGGAKVAS